MGDRYDDLTGPELASELTGRGLSVTGKVGELRARLRDDDEKRAQEPADGPSPDHVGEEQADDGSEVPEPREPVEYRPDGLVLTEEQARQLTRGEARLRASVKHVNPMTERKYAAGDRVVVIFAEHDRRALVLPFGIEIELTEEQD